MTLHSSPTSVHTVPKPQRGEDGSQDCPSESERQRLIIVSNRVADLQSTTQSGGLVVGVADALGKHGGVWFGWDGRREGETGGPVETSQNGAVTRVGAPISPEDFSDYYLEYSNSVLWPLFHYRLDLVHITPTAFDGYMRVNEAFARQLLPILQPNDLVWVHDYHLLPLAFFLRKLGCRQRIGHFLHIPFPPPELLSATPHHGKLIDTMLEYDLLGFQTHTDVGNLKSYLSTTKSNVTVTDTHVRTGQKTVRIGRFPIGIDVADFNELSRKSDPDAEIASAWSEPMKRQRIIGVDRLDYSKGLPERFKAFDDLLLRHQDLVRHVSFVQITPPSRTEVDAYADIRVELEQLAGSINGRFAELDWTPVQYICRPLPRNVLAPLMRHSDVGFVTPLRDGMNLVAKEYVAAQDPEDPGVLILSQFAGAAEEMQEALIVNPYDVEHMADQLHRALTMPLRERCARHAALMGHITTFDAKNWSNTFLSALKGAI